MDQHPALDRLMSWADPFDHPATDGVFLAAMQESLAWHDAHNPVYHTLCEMADFPPERLQTFDQVSQVPWIFVNVFKHHELLSVPREAVALHLTSSGTSGQKSQIFFDQGSMDRGLDMVRRCFDAFGLVNEAEEVNYLLFAYDPEEAKHVGTAATDDFITGFAKKHRTYHALRWNARTAAFEFDLERTYAMLLDFAAEGYPVRILGFPAFLHRLLAHHREQGGQPLSLGLRSFVLTGGGWKTAEDEQIDKPAFIAEVSTLLGIPPGNLRDGFGMVEHGVPYIECEAHRFHVPVYARAYTRDVATLALLPLGAEGFLHLVTPYLYSMPAISLLTSDMAVIGADCPCGRPTTTVELRGRAGTRKNKGCAIAASQLLKSL
ncbi:MAG: acyl-protein synthetase [Candidatus Sericytochromatia bacterium]|nr:acyl-protein synthetase [Candidatus Sericytochromatia bacterium]